MKKPQQVLFFKIGGTWDMTTKKGKLEGEGALDDNALWNYENKLGYFKKHANYKKLEWVLAKKIETILQEEIKTAYNSEECVRFVPNISSFVSGKFITLFSGDSSHLRNSLIAPIATFLIQQAIAHPQTPILGAQGTDTADIALLPLLDAYTFDTNLPPFIFTGSNKSFREHDSDAPENFLNLFKIANITLRAGAYWVFAAYMFGACDVVKISPLESRTIEDFSIFYSPHLRARKIKEVLSDTQTTPFISKKMSPNHIVYRMKMKELFESMEQVHVVNLGQQSDLNHDIATILNPAYKAIIIAGHSFGNVSNPIKYACWQAAKKNKLVILTSRCLVSNVNMRYGTSLLYLNTEELRGTNKKIISAYKLSNYIARALAVRAVHDDLNQEQGQKLFDAYALSRELSEYDVVVS